MATRPAPIQMTACSQPQRARTHAPRAHPHPLAAAEQPAPTPPPAPSPAPTSAPAAKPARTALTVPAANPARGKPANPWLWNVVLLDDQEHTDVYVIAMMQSLFAMSADRATHIADLVDGHGRAIVMTTHKELAELKRDQILAFGKDPQVGSCSGSMSAVIEPAGEDQQP